MEYEFKDFYNNTVHLSFTKQPFSSSPKHVWIICNFQGKWLLTKHRSRGLEFPGGNVEENECAEEAAHREVMEETGATIKKLQYIAQYKVIGKNETIIKNVYYAEVDQLIERETYYETEGPVLLEELPANLKRNSQYSFMMKDEVVIRSMQFIKEMKLNK